MKLEEKLMNIQTELKAPKNLYNSFGKYSYRNAEGIQEAVKPLLKKYNCTLTLSDCIDSVGDRVYILSRAVLSDCESDDKIQVQAYARESSDKKGMDDAQITGATSSYARKYALNGLFLLDDTKDVDTEEYQKQKNQAKITAAPKNATPNSEWRAKLRQLVLSSGFDMSSVVKQFGLNSNSTDADFKNAYESLSKEVVAKEQSVVEMLTGGGQ